MAESLYSESWYRVAEIKPRLRMHARIHRHIYRGAVWYVLQDQSSGRFHRFSPIANMIIGLMDGRRTVQSIWDAACEQLGDDVPSQDEVIKLLSDLHRADVLQTDAPPDIHEQNVRRKQHIRKMWKQYLGNPMSLRFPLFDPDRLVGALVPLMRPLFNGWGVLLWLIVVGTGATLGAMHWAELSNDVVDQVFSMENLLLMSLIFPLVKFVHEMGHAIAAKAGGGEVHEMGVMLLVMMPTPYVDASSAAGFRDKRLRMLVGASGMLIELFLASIAMVFWVYLTPGLERSIAYNIMLIAGVSTVLFNANPLLRYDGYYILADWLEMPNLGQRANEYFGYLLNRYVFGVERLTSPTLAAGEGPWFVFYAIASFAYRMFVAASIVLLVASRFFVIGILLALWAATTMVLVPAGKQLAYLFNSPKLRYQRRRAVITSGMALALVAGALFILPAPSSTRTEGVIWAPPKSQVRATVDCFVRDVAARSGQDVQAGAVLVQCEDPELDARRRVVEAQLAELQARYDSASLSSRVQGGLLREQIDQTTSAVQLAQQRQREQQILSPVDGRFVLENAQNLPGRFVQRGELIGYVTDKVATTVRVVVPQSDADRVRKRTLRVEIRPVDDIPDVMQARVVRAVPAATDELPSAALSLQGGGQIGMDPGKRGEPKALEKLFIFDLELPESRQANNLGSRMYVRFVHDNEPIANQWYRSVRRLFLKKFNV